MRDPATKVVTRAELSEARAHLKAEGKQVVFTNGCFDIVHAGHVQYLDFSRRQGDALVVGINSDASVRRNKGPDRPINNQDDRAFVIAGLESVDYVVIFEEDEPKELITEIIPDVLIKGEQWAHYVSGREIVEANGGRVVLATMLDGRSSTAIIEKVRETTT